MPYRLEVLQKRFQVRSSKIRKDVFQYESFQL
jgi:hypothetical protein